MVLDSPRASPALWKHWWSGKRVRSKTSLLFINRKHGLPQQGGRPGRQALRQRLPFPLPIPHKASPSLHRAIVEDRNKDGLLPGLHLPPGPHTQARRAGGRAGVTATIWRLVCAAAELGLSRPGCRYLPALPAAPGGSSPQETPCLAWCSPTLRAARLSTLAAPRCKGCRGEATQPGEASSQRLSADRE